MKKRTVKDPKLELYRRILRQIWEDGIVTSDEYAIMEKIREGLDITLEEHLELESEVYLNLARTEFERVHHEEAMELYDKAINRDPKNELAWMNKGFHLQSLGRYDDAVKCFDEVLKLKPKNHHALTVKGCAMMSAERHKEALAVFDKALKLSPKDEWVWYNKGLAHFHLEQKDKAKKAFKKALALKPSFTGPIKYLEVIEAGL